MNCPRCQNELKVEFHDGIEVDHCPSCNGRWLDPGELDHLESTVPSTPEQREATVQYARRESDLTCPICQTTMVAFNYRAYNLELDTCSEEHGFWLDAGEGGKVKDIIEERIKGLGRSADAEVAWAGFLGGLRGGKPSIVDRISGLFKGGKS